jgi:hypothetical protein
MYVSLPLGVPAHHHEDLVVGHIAVVVKIHDRLIGGLVEHVEVSDHGITGRIDHVDRLVERVHEHVLPIDFVVGQFAAHDF